ncbi:MAG TPA: ATP-binding protein [Prolixibacteraceae bacterium]|nr:ATP-binding protein [Prolixibacteraceae bacterium]
MDQKNYLKEKMDQTKDMVMNRVLIVIMFVVTLGIAISLMRISQTGFLFNYGVQIFLALVILFLYLFRNRLKTKTKGIIFLCCLYILALSGLISFGLYGFGWAYFIPAASISFLYFNKRTGWTLSLSSLLVILVIGMMFNRGILEFYPEKNGYMQSLPMWLNMIITASLISILITMFWNNLFDLLSNTFTHINYQQEDMAKMNRELIIARDKAMESDRLKSSFLANISHEIRTPLNIIIGFSHMLAQTDDPEEREELNQVVLANSNIMLKMVNDIVDFSKIETNTLNFNNTQFNMKEVLNSIEKELCMKVPDNVRLTIDKEEEQLTTDKDRFQQILFNLLDNALKFTAEGDVSLQIRKENGWLLFRVSDTGMGIPDGEHEKIFDRFYKIDKFSQGSGLGLSLSKSMANMMGGDITVESEPGKGSTFSFILPATILN